MSTTQYTFGNNYNRGNSFWVYNSADSHFTIFPIDDLANPITSTSASGRHTIAFGKDKLVAQIYTTRPYTTEVRAFNNLSISTPFSYMDQTQTESLTNNYPYTISFGNDMWMSLPNRTSSVAGDVRTSTTGNGFTTYSGVLPANTGTLAPAVYNPDDGRWATCKPGTTSIYYSDNDGATWSTATAPVAVQAPAYGNGTWVFSAGSNGAVYSTNNLTNMSQVTGLNTNYNIHYNEWDQTFWLGAGFYTGSIFNARIYSSTNGISWTTRYSGTAPFLVQDIIGDDSGNYIAMGVAYSGGYIDTDAYLYSTDSGANWTQGTLPSARQMLYSTNQMAWASIERGTPPEGTPPAPTYDVSVDKTSVSENGETITWTINTSGVVDGSTLYYDLYPLPTDGFTDFTDVNYNGSITINSNTATVTRTTSADNRTEGTDTVRLRLKVNSVTGTVVAESDDTVISDTSQTPPPPSKAQPSVTSGSVQNFSVPLTVLTTQEVTWSFQVTNNTPYSYTIDLKFKDDYLNESAGDIFYSFDINSYTVLSLNNNSLILPKGWNYNEAPNFNFTLLVDARTAPGTPDEIDFNISRTPFNPTFSPPSGGSEPWTGSPTTTPVTLSGGEPNSPWFWNPVSAPYPVESGSNQFNSSGVSTQNIDAGARGTYTWTVVWVDGRTTTYTRTYT
jgi:hypothetical protein